MAVLGNPCLTILKLWEPLSSVEPHWPQNQQLQQRTEFLADFYYQFCGFSYCKQYEISFGSIAARFIFIGLKAISGGHCTYSFHHRTGNLVIPCVTRASLSQYLLNKPLILINNWFIFHKCSHQKAYGVTKSYACMSYNSFKQQPLRHIILIFIGASFAPPPFLSRNFDKNIKFSHFHWS